MARKINQRAPKWLAAALLLVQLFQPLCAPSPVLAQDPMMGSPGPMMQVGPDGTVNLDQMMGASAPSMGTPYYAGQPMMAAPATAYSPYGAQPLMAQPYAAQPWGTQAVQPQTPWGPPLLPSPEALTGGPIQPFYLHRTSVFGEVLFIRPRDAEVAYALPIAGPVNPMLGNEVPVGPVAIVDPDYDIAFRAGFNYALDQGSSLRAQYTRLDSETENSVTVAAPTVLRSLVSHPLGSNAATDTPSASASLDIFVDQIDADFRSLWLGSECNCAYAVNYFIGANYAKLDQEFNSSFVNTGTTSVNTDIEFKGGGMRFGLEGERFWPQRQIFVYGTGVTNFLFGEFDANYFQINSASGTGAATSWSAGRIVPVLDLEVGAGWLGVNRHLRLSAGYRLSTWFNVVKTDDWIWAVQNRDFRNLDGTLTFDGLVGRAEWLF